MTQEMLDWLKQRADEEMLNIYKCQGNIFTNLFKSQNKKDADYKKLCVSKGKIELIHEIFKKYATK